MIMTVKTLQDAIGAILMIDSGTVEILTVQGPRRKATLIFAGFDPDRRRYVGIAEIAKRSLSPYRLAKVLLETI